MYKIINYAFIIGNLNQLFQLISRLLLIPVLITNLGIELYSNWLYINAIISILAISNFGVSTSKLNEIYTLRDDNHNFNYLYLNTLNFNIIFSFLLIIVSIFILLILEIKNYKDYLILIIYYSSLHTFNFLINYFQAIGKQHVDAFINIAISFIQFVLLYFVSLYNTDIIILSLSLIIPYIPICYIIAIKHIIPIYKPIFNIKLFKSIQPIYFSIIQLNGFILNSLPIIILKHLSTSEIIVAFNLYKTISNLLIRFVSMYPNASWPTLTEYFNYKNSKVVTNIYNISLCLFLISLLIVLIFIKYEFFEFLFDLFIPELIININNFYIVLFYTVIISIQQLKLIFIQSFNKVKQISLIIICSNIIFYVLLLYINFEINFEKIILIFSLFEYYIFVLSLFYLYKQNIINGFIFKNFIINIILFTYGIKQFFN